MKMDEQKKEKVPEEVKRSDFGCCNCLWNGVECRNGDKYTPKKAIDGSPSCRAYSYYD